jgi:hypothetical protein
MKKHQRQIAGALALAASLTLAGPAAADTTISTFDYFTSGALYASWTTATIDSGPTAYIITATGYGSNWKYLGTIDASGETNIELTVTLSGPPAADGHLGPIVSFVDADGTYVNYAWYGRTLGHHVLTMPVALPSSTNSPGTTPGLDLATLTHMHLQLDPGGFGAAGAYTISWEDLRLTGAPGPTITATTFNPATHEFSLTWTSKPNLIYSVLYAAKLTDAFTPLVTDVWATDKSTSTTVTLPSGESGFLRIQQQQ